MPVSLLTCLGVPCGKSTQASSCCCAPYPETKTITFTSTVRKTVTAGQRMARRWQTDETPESGRVAQLLLPREADPSGRHLCSACPTNATVLLRGSGKTGVAYCCRRTQATATKTTTKTVTVTTTKTPVPKATIHGRLFVDNDGNGLYSGTSDMPVSKAALSVYATGRSGPLLGTGMTDAQGLFAILIAKPKPGAKLVLIGPAGKALIAFAADPRGSIAPLAIPMKPNNPPPRTATEATAPETRTSTIPAKKSTVTTNSRTQTAVSEMRFYASGKC